MCLESVDLAGKYQFKRVDQLPFVLDCKGN